MIQMDRLMAHDLGVLDASYTAHDAALYALSVGVGLRPTDAMDLPFVCGPDLQALPSFATVLGWPGRLTDPAFGIDQRMVVASDLEVELHEPLQSAARLQCQPRIAHVFDKGEGGAAIVCTERTLKTPEGQAVATVRNSILARNHGGFGGPPDSRVAPKAPERAPDAVCDLITAPNQALLFRLHGDTNPIHSDPAMATRVGFARPLLHGACTFGVAGFALLRSVLQGDASRLASMRARFAKPFFPGETLRTQAWVEGQEVHFRCLSVESGDVVLDQGLARLRAA
jgi:acyl dehydratase